MKRAQILSLILIIMLVVFLILKFTKLKYYNPISKGRPGWSKSIEESKKRGVFIGRFNSPTSPILINDSIKVNIEEAWIEYMWLYDLFINNSKKIKAIKQILIKVNPLDMKGYNNEWIISENREFKRGFGYWDGTLMLKHIYGDSLIQKIEWPVRKLDTTKQLSYYYPLDTIGKIILEFENMDENSK